MESVKKGRAAGSYDLAVVGGGPAGTSAAITAARSGARVLLVERGRLPRQRVCGEFVSWESLDLLESLLANAKPEFLQRALRIRETRLFVDGRTIAAPVAPAAASLARWDLDNALWQAALLAGVDARLNTSVESIAGTGPFTLNTSAGQFTARALINAAGRWSNLKRNSESGSGSLDHYLGLKGHFAESSPPTSVDLYFFEGGYCGVQPVQLATGSEGVGRVNACAMVRADKARTLPQVFARHPQLAKRAQAWSPLTEAVTTSPLRFGTPAPVQGGLLAAGDAAGFVDPFVGDGISLALRSGTLAAECLALFFAGQQRLEDARAEYARCYRTRLLPVFRSSSKLRRLLRLPPSLRSSLALILERTPVITRYLVTASR